MPPRPMPPAGQAIWPIFRQAEPEASRPAPPYSLQQPSRHIADSAAGAASAATAALAGTTQVCTRTGSSRVPAWSQMLPEEPEALPGGGPSGRHPLILAHAVVQPKQQFKPTRALQHPRTPRRQLAASASGRRLRPAPQPRSAIVTTTLTTLPSAPSILTAWSRLRSQTEPRRCRFTRRRFTTPGGRRLVHRTGCPTEPGSALPPSPTHDPQHPMPMGRPRCASAAGTGLAHTTAAVIARHG